MIDRNKLV